MSRKPTVFISYSRNDVEIARQVVSFLENECNQCIWIDEREINLGDSFLERMNEGLSSSSYVLVLFSESSLSSKWVQREWLSSLANESIVLIPVLIEPNITLPVLLRDYLYLNLSSDIQSGLAQLKLFFQKELTEVGSLSTKTRRGEIKLNPNQISLLKGASRREIRLVTQACMNETKFLAFLFDEEINPNEIAGDSLDRRLVNLLHRNDLEGDLEIFVAWLCSEMYRCVQNQLKVIRGL